MTADDLDWVPGPPELLKPGMLLRDKWGAFDLVGHINEEGGTCEHCYGYVATNVAAWAMLPLPEGVSL